MIVVGITNTDRTRDLTPTHVGKAFYHDSLVGWNTESMKTSGGGENFSAFIERELMPHIDSLYPTAPYHVFIGHSFGGLTVVNSLLNHPNLFNAYIAIDPALWWDNQKLLKQAEKDLVKKKFDDKVLFLAIANVKPASMDTLQMKKDTTPNTLHIRSNFRLTEALNKNKQNHLHYASKYYNNDDHGTVPIIGTYDGLRFLFNYYKINLPTTAQEIVKVNVDSAFTVHFNNISKKMGYTILPPLNLVNGYGYYLLTLKDFKQAHKLFQRNIDNYPSSFLVYDGMGDYYKEIGEKEKAIEFYKKTLSLFDYPETKIKLEKLQTGK
jgi:predicted alpha/beta superfamily hydrolase